MRIRLRYLFWGLFLIPLGAVPLLVQADYLQAESLRDAWRWWPLVLVGLGVALILGRSRAGLVGTAVFALLLGGLAGSALAGGNLWFGSITECATAGGEMSTTDASDVFAGSAAVTLDLDCGTVDVTTEPGSAWRLHGAYRGSAPVVDASASALAIRSPNGPPSHRQEWTLAVGADALREIALTLNAGSSSASLDGADLASVRADMNAGDLLLDGRGATIGRLDASVNAGRLRLTLGDGATTGQLSVNAGAIELCVPPTATLRFHVNDQLTFPTNLGSRGLDHDGETWTRQGSGDLIDLRIEGNAASFTLDPAGGCK